MKTGSLKYGRSLAKVKNRLARICRDVPGAGDTAYRGLLNAIEAAIDEAVRENRIRCSLAATMGNPGCPGDIRAKGWSVAVHNDYRLNGVPHTFWLFTKGDFAVKGEGPTDAVALNHVRAQIPLREKDIEDLGLLATVRNLKGA